MLQNRLKSKAVWVAVIAVISGLVTHYIPNFSTDYQLLTDSIVTLLVLFGILNNPTDHTQF